MSTLINPQVPFHTCGGRGKRKERKMPVGTITIESGEYKAHIVIDNQNVTGGIEFRGKIDRKSPDFLFVKNCQKMILDRLKEI